MYLVFPAQSGAIKTVVVAHKDRLARFATEVIEWYIGGRLIIQNSNNKCPELKILWQSSTFSLACSMEKWEPRVTKREDLPRASNYKLALTYMSNMF